MKWNGEQVDHWAMQYIDLPWVFGATGPDAYDCFGLVRHIQKQHFGIDMWPEMLQPTWSLTRQLIENSEQRKQWTQVKVPVDGNVALMARNRHPVHIGVVVKAGNVLGIVHCMQGAGVVFQNLQALRATGWGGLTYYRHHTCTPTA